MPDLSILIPARNEIFLKQTIENILENMRGDTEIIAVLDGYWPTPSIKDHPKVTLIHYTEPVGQREGVNLAARLSKAEFIMKMDAHCSADEGFDSKIIAGLDHNCTVVPRMYNLHGFDWVCSGCGNHIYQGPTPKKCGICDNKKHEREMIWKPRLKARSDFMRFDNELRFQYWKEYESRTESRGDVCDLMCLLGACWVMKRERFWELGGLDIRHGSWGQMGVEIACKSWLSGGRLVVNKTTWFSHMFRTQGKDFGFPYPMKKSDCDAARNYSHWLWLGGNWDKAVRPFKWIIDKFSPVPDWS